MAAQGISPFSLISSSTIKERLETIQDIPKTPEEKEKLARQLIINEFDFTHSGSLNRIEAEHFTRALERELTAHKKFIGASFKRIGCYIIGRTLGFGATCIVKWGINVRYENELNQVQKNSEYHHVALKIQQETEGSEKYAALKQFESYA